MEKFIPYEKLSKKEKRKVDATKRNTWGDLNPVTRKPQNSKAYCRNKARSWKREILHEPTPGQFYFSRSFNSNTFSSINRIVSMNASSSLPVGSSSPQSSR